MSNFMSFKVAHPDIPLRYLLSTSPAFFSLEQEPSEADLTRCVRSSPSSHLDVRMLISEPPGNAWFERGPGGLSSAQSESGGFEIRRKDWEKVLKTLADGSWTKDSWDRCTVYLVSDFLSDPLTRTDH